MVRRCLSREPFLRSHVDPAPGGSWLDSEKETYVNKNQIKGAATNAAGKVQEKAGQVTGNAQQQDKGLVKQV